MKIFISTVLILFFSACGIDKESPPPPPLSSIGNSGELDTSYFNQGYITFNSVADGIGNDEVVAMTKDSLGRIIAVGSSTNPDGHSDLVVWRFNPEGNLDTSFADQGIFIHNNAAGGDGNDRGLGVVTGSSNEIYISGSSQSPDDDTDMVVWKLTPSGQLDNSFNGTGIFTHHDAGGGELNDQGTAIKLDFQGRIVVAGSSFYSSTRRAMALWRLLPNGTLDKDFNGTGFVSYSGCIDCNNFGNSLVIDFSNNIIVAGRADQEASSVIRGNMALWKFLSDGSEDTSFGSGGLFTHHSAAGGNGLDTANDLILAGSGHILVTGFSRNSSGNNDMVVWRLNLNGSLDTSFRSTGFSVIDNSVFYGISSNDIGEKIRMDSQGRILVVGACKEDLCAWRLSENGSIDPSFGGSGFVSHDSAAGGFSLDSGNSFVFDSEGRIFVGGYSRNPANNFEATFWRIR
jgi:uncharacterized delta-60 repeat protein